MFYASLQKTKITDSVPWAPMIFKNWRQIESSEAFGRLKTEIWVCPSHMTFSLIFEISQDSSKSPRHSFGGDLFAQWSPQGFAITFLERWRDEHLNMWVLKWPDKIRTVRTILVRSDQENLVSGPGSDFLRTPPIPRGDHFSWGLLGPSLYGCSMIFTEQREGWWMM